MKLACALLAGCVLILPAFGTTAFYVIQKDQRFEQDGPTTINTNGFDFIGLIRPNPTDPFDAGTLDIPGNPSVALSSLGGGFFEFASVVSDQTTFNAAFPMGTYTFHGSDSADTSQNEDVAVADTLESFPTVIPALGASTFNALAGLDPTQNFVFNFNTFTGAASPFDGGLIFLEILNLGDGTVPFEVGVQPNVGQITLPGGTLSPGANYEWVLFFQNADVGTNTQLETDNRTRGFFSTATGAATPEPSSVVLLGAGLIALAARARLGSRRGQPGATPPTQR